MNLDKIKSSLISLKDKIVAKLKPVLVSLKDKINTKLKPVLVSLKEKLGEKLSRFSHSSNDSNSSNTSNKEPTLNPNLSSTTSTEASSDPAILETKPAAKSSDILSNHLDNIDTEEEKELSVLKKKRILRYLIYTCSFIVLFLIFFLMSFPYSILKETITTKLEEVSGLSVTIEDVSIALPLGVKLYNINFKSNELNYTIKKMKVKLSFVSLCLLTLKARVDVLDSKKGSLSIVIKEGILRLLFSKNKLPSLVKIHSKNFSLTEIVDVFLSKLSSDSTMNPMIAPLLNEVYITGVLNTNINVSIASNPKNSNGSILIKLDSATLGLKDPSLNIPEQKFEHASLKVNIKNGEVVIDKDSKIESSDLFVGFEGKISLEEKIALSNINVNIPIKLKGALFNSYGFMLGGGSGSSTIMITGTFNNISTYQR